MQLLQTDERFSLRFRKGGCLALVYVWLGYVEAVRRGRIAGEEWHADGALMCQAIDQVRELQAGGVVGPGGFVNDPRPLVQVFLGDRAVAVFGAENDDIQLREFAYIGRAQQWRAAGRLSHWVGLSQYGGTYNPDFRSVSFGAGDPTGQERWVYVRA